MQVFDLDLATERDTVITLRGLKMENSDVVNCIDKLDPSKMSVVQLKALEKKLDAVVIYYNSITTFKVTIIKFCGYIFLQLRTICAYELACYFKY